MNLLWMTVVVWLLGNALVDASSQYTDRSQKLVSELYALDLQPIFTAAKARNFLLSAHWPGFFSVYRDWY